MLMRNNQENGDYLPHRIVSFTKVLCVCKVVWII